MFGKFFDTSEVDALAAWIVGEVQRTLRPSEVDGAGKKAAERRRSLDVRIAKRISEHLRRCSVNFY